MDTTSTPPTPPAAWRPPVIERAVAAPGNYVAYVSHLGVVRFTRAADLGDGWLRLAGADVEDAAAILPFGSLPAELECRACDVRWAAEYPGDA